MGYDEYLTSREDKHLLRRFAYIGSRDAFSKKLRFLEGIAEKGEKWRFYDQSVPGGVMDVLYHYVMHTFDRVYQQNKISIDKDETAAAFNTGLLTDAGQEIYCTFSVFDHYDRDDPTKNYWYLQGFFNESHRNYLNLNLDAPKMATYFEEYNELYFDPDLEISINYEHIIVDNADRLPPRMREMDMSNAASFLGGSLDTARKRIRRNSRIPVPQFYNGEIMFLIPLKIFGETVVLAVEKHDGQYRANTVLTFSMAYNNARLLARPESNWLMPK